MTNEEKLKKLLIIALANGWKPNNKLTEVDVVSVWNNRNILCIAPYINGKALLTLKTSLASLVGEWGEKEVGFIEALCKADSTIINYAVDNDMYNTYLDLHINIIRDWFTIETSDRLNRLFEIFNHLL
jgi:hypothetical protein